MDRRLLRLAALMAVVFASGAVPAALADRLGGNFRGPDDVYVVREDPKGGPPTGGNGDGGGGKAKDDAPAGDGNGGGSGDSGDHGDGAPPNSNGGQYRGPNGEAPPDGRGTEDPPPPDTGGANPPDGGSNPGSGSTPDGESAPDSGGGAPAGGGPAGSSASSGGPGKGAKGAQDDRDRIWPFYFEGAKEEYLAAVVARRQEHALSPRGTSTSILSALPPAPEGVRAVDEADRAAALALAMARLRDADSHVRDAAVLALGKSGSADAVPFLEMAAATDPDRAVREDALLALGLSGRAAEALPPLLKAVAATPRGAGDLRPAFAALGLGLLGDREGAAPALRTLYAASSFRADRASDAACAATALGMLGDAGALPLFEKTLSAKTAPDAVKAFTLHALGKFGAHGDPRVRASACALLLPALEGRKELKRGALLALGGFPDNGAIEALVRDGLTDPDSHCRNFAAHSLGRIAARAGADGRARALVERELARVTDSDRRDRWLFQAGNLALSSIAAEGAEKRLVDQAAELRALNLHSASSVVLSLGMLGAESPEAAREIRTAFGSRASGRGVQAYAGLALAMTGAPGSAEALADTLRSAEAPPVELARSAALAIGLVGGAREADLLVEVLAGSAGGKDGGAERFFVMGAAVQGLGLIGDGNTVERLKPLLDSRDSWTRRAFATAALGYVLERDPAHRVSPRISEIFRHHDYLLTLPVVKAVQSTL
jgi:HEAT repeat protein